MKKPKLLTIIANLLFYILGVLFLTLFSIIPTDWGVVMLLPLVFVLAFAVLYLIIMFTIVYFMNLKNRKKNVL